MLSASCEPRETRPAVIFFFWRTVANASQKKCAETSELLNSAVECDSAPPCVTARCPVS